MSRRKGGRERERESESKEETERNNRAKKSHKAPATRPWIITIAHCPHNDHNNEAAGIYSSNIGSRGSGVEPLSWYLPGYQYECQCHRHTASSIHTHGKHFSTAREGAVTCTKSASLQRDSTTDNSVPCRSGSQCFQRTAFFQDMFGVWLYPANITPPCQQRSPSPEC